jgi:single-stranded-DNA-specific exonuclease
VDGQSIQAVCFGDAKAFMDYYSSVYGVDEVAAAFSGRPNALRMSITYYPEINTYNGTKSVQIVIRNYK